MTADKGLSELQLDALRELMNIGFGQAAKALSEVIDMHVVLSVPKILVLGPVEVASFISAEVGTCNAFSMVEQVFFGHFWGTSFLLLPAPEHRKFHELFNADDSGPPSGADPGIFEQEYFLEIGNIVIGACVGKIAELLRDQVSFRPPIYIAPPLDEGIIVRQIGEQKSLALVFKTVFHFDQEDICGFLFLVASESVLGWVRGAVADYLEGVV